MYMYPNRRRPNHGVLGTRVRRLFSFSLKRRSEKKKFRQNRRTLLGTCGGNNFLITLSSLYYEDSCARWLRTGPGRSGSEYWTRIRSFSSFLSMHKTQQADANRAVRNADPDPYAGSVVRCCTGFAPFYGTGAKVDVRIRTLGPISASHLLNRVPYRLKTLKSPKTAQIHTKGGANLFNLLKTVGKIFLKLPEWDANPDPDLRIRTRQKSIKTRNTNIFGSGRDQYQILLFSLFTAFLLLKVKIGIPKPFLRRSTMDFQAHCVLCISHQGWLRIFDWLS
jgi:hypothetical protein